MTTNLKRSENREKIVCAFVSAENRSEPSLNPAQNLSVCFLCHVAFLLCLFVPLFSFILHRFKSNIL